ncbi:Forkhead box protein O3 [Desmophyllum pertusum]|uniref:Forkhead box protein O3 n=1 Tax=Desmophyllum pertusum TaxID=174260 RepID=A0A9W9YUR9_9CNID|nr:Forkhead box protein O3 [Desmophyllum pertusum]
MITKDHIMYGKHLLNQEFLSLNDIKKERNEQKHTNLGHHLTGNQNIMNGGMRFTNPRINSDATRRSQLPVDREQCKQGRTAAFIMEHNMADLRGREIPLYSPGRYKTMTSDDMLWHHRKLRSVAMENGKRQFVPEANYHYTSPSRAQVIRLSYPWAYLGNIPPVMYPVQANYRNSGHVMTRDRFRVDPRLLKGKYEQTYSQVLPLNKDSQSSNSEEDDGESMGRAEQIKQHVIKQENSEGQTMGKEEAYSLALLLNNESTSDSRSSNSEEDDGHMQTCNNTIASENAGQRMDHPHHQNNFQETGSTVEDQSEGGDRQSKAPHSVCVDSLTGLNTSESNNLPVIPNHKSASNGYSHHPSKKNQAQEGDAEGGSPVSNNPWGKGSYSDLITMALMSSPERKMKLNEIYRWITMNIPYFRNKGDEISSSGWKNSIRHTLSVRQRFVRLPRVTNESVSHKSWWTLSDDFLRKRPALGASSKKPSMPVTNKKYVSKETQTLEFVCGRCSRAIFKK